MPRLPLWVAYDFIASAPVPQRAPTLRRPTWWALERLLADPARLQDVDAIGACVADYHRDALHINALRGKQTGHALRRVVYLLSTNAQKTAEYARSFDRYGIEVLRAPVSDNPHYVRALLQAGCKGLVVMSVHREQNALYDLATQQSLDTTQELAVPRDVLNVSTLRVAKCVSGEIVKRTYTASRHGRLDPSKNSADPRVFGWDDVFVPSGLAGHPSFFELRERGHKVSPRDAVVGQYIAADVHHGQAKDFNASTNHFLSRTSTGPTITTPRWWRMPRRCAIGGSRSARCKPGATSRSPPSMAS